MALDNTTMGTTVQGLLVLTISHFMVQQHALRLFFSVQRLHGFRQVVTHVQS